MGQRYTVRDTQTGKRVTFQWNGAEPPTEADMTEVFAEARQNLPEAKPAPPQQPALGRFVEGVKRTTIDPLVDLAKTAVTTAPWNFPRVIGEQIAGGMIDQGQKAVAKGREAFSAPNLPAALMSGSEAVGHGVAAALPVIGPVAAGIGERAATGDIAGAAGELTGLVAPSAVKGALPSRGAIAAKAEQMSTNRLANVMAPKVGQNKVRFGNKAAEVAPRLAREEGLGAVSREGLQSKVEGRLAQAEAALDNAADKIHASQIDKPGAAYGAGSEVTTPTRPLLNALRAKRQQLVAEALEGSRTMPALEGPGGRPTPSGLTRNIGSGRMQKAPRKTERPIGRDVEPGPNAPRIAVLDRAIAEISQLGPVARYESIRRIRQAYDGPAKAVYAPSVTADYMAKMGEKYGAADVTGVLRERLSGMSPETAAANADYSLYKSASDVLQAAEEVQRVRPTVGRKMLAAATGGAVTEMAGVGMAAGVVFGPLLDELLSAGVTTKIASARTLASLADALRKHQTKRATTLLGQLQRAGRMSQIKPVASHVPQAAEGQQPEDQYAR